jgi:hypothetical protein
MSSAVTLRSWLYRLAASVSSAWHCDRVFRWMVIGAGVSLTVFVLRPKDPATPRPTASAQPGLYKLRLWATCTPTPSLRNQRVSVALLEKAPSDLNLRPVTGEDLAHKQR